jgi:hypothetical protein
MAPMRVHNQMEALHVQGSAVIDRRYSLCIFSLACPADVSRGG